MSKRGAYFHAVSGDMAGNADIEEVLTDNSWCVLAENFLEADIASAAESD